jgi:hypothetical protein
MLYFSRPLEARNQQIDLGAMKGSARFEESNGEFRLLIELFQDKNEIIDDAKLKESLANTKDISISFRQEISYMF